MKTNLYFWMIFSLFVLLIVLPVSNFYLVEYHEIESGNFSSDNGLISYQAGYSRNKEVFLLLWTDTTTELDVAVETVSGDKYTYMLDENVNIDSRGIRILFPFSDFFRVEIFQIDEPFNETSFQEFSYDSYFYPRLKIIEYRNTNQLVDLGDERTIILLGIIFISVITAYGFDRKRLKNDDLNKTSNFPVDDESAKSDTILFPDTTSTFKLETMSRSNWKDFDTTEKIILISLFLTILLFLVGGFFGIFPLIILVGASVIFYLQRLKELPLNFKSDFHFWTNFAIFSTSIIYSISDWNYHLSNYHIFETIPMRSLVYFVPTFSVLGILYYSLKDQDPVNTLQRIMIVIKPLGFYLVFSLLTFTVYGIIMINNNLL